MLPQEESLDVLMEFLLHFGYSNVKGVHMDAIRQLASIVLKENVFNHEKKFYRQVVGGAMGSAFTLTLANIFMWKWEKQLVEKQISSNEIYGQYVLSEVFISLNKTLIFYFIVRYIDDIFLTSNESLETVNEMLDKANHIHPNIKLTRVVASSLPFLDVFIENNNGTIQTSAYHKVAAEPYVLPFKSDHPRHIFKNVIETALLRALRYSSTFETFNKERRSIELMLLYNG
jgi:hypothetical protein